MSVGVPTAAAKFSATAVGSGRAKAIQLATPPAPTAVATSLIGLACTVNVSWPAPPAGRQYTIYRVVDGASVAFRTNQTTAGTNQLDAFVLPGLFARNISYFIRSSLITATQWTKDSLSTPVTC